MSNKSTITEFLTTAVADHIFPGAVVGYLKNDKVDFVSAGHLTYDSNSPLVTKQTLYDVASVTKSIPTNSLILWLIDQGELTLDDPAITYLPEIQNKYRAEITVRHLLTYTVALDSPRGLSTYAQEGHAKIKEMIFTTDLRAAPGEKYHYTNTPAIFLGLIAERITGKTLDTLAQEVFFTPLGMSRTTFIPQTFPKNEVAPTETDWRGEVWGEVHDEAAWALRQDSITAGNAGLFSTAGDLLTFAQMLLANGTWQGNHYFKPETVVSMHTNQLTQLGECAGLGWELNQPHFMGQYVQADTFGKTGFTGCSIVIDPKKKATLVLLSNRLHPQRPTDNRSINQLRRVLADSIFC